MSEKTRRRRKPIVIFAPATLCEQWQTEMIDKLGIPCARWHSNRKVWLDPEARAISPSGPEHIARCPLRIGMESTNEPNARRLFRGLREDLGLRREDHLAGALTDLAQELREDLETEFDRVIDGVTFFQRENPLVRHVVLRKRVTLEERGLLDTIAVNIHPAPGLVSDPHRFNALFQDLALRTTPDFDRAYAEARAFGRVLAQRGKGGGFMKNLMEQRLCSSVVAGLQTATTLLQGCEVDEEAEEIDLELAIQTDAERAALEALMAALKGMGDDPKLRAIRFSTNSCAWVGMAERTQIADAYEAPRSMSFGRLSR